MTSGEIISAIVGAIVGAGLSIPITLKISSYKVNQNNNKTGGGDIVGRDKN